MGTQIRILPHHRQEDLGHQIPGPAPSIPDICVERLGFSTVPNGNWNVEYPEREAGPVKHVWDSAA